MYPARQVGRCETEPSRPSANRVSFWAAPVAETFRIDLIIEFQDTLATIDASSATGEPNLYQYLDQVAPIFQHAVPTITVSVAPPDEGLVGWKAMIYRGLDIYPVSHPCAYKFANVVHGGFLLIDHMSRLFIGRPRSTWASRALSNAMRSAAPFKPGRRALENAIRCRGIVCTGRRT